MCLCLYKNMVTGTKDYTEACYPEGGRGWDGAMRISGRGEREGEGISLWLNSMYGISVSFTVCAGIERCMKGRCPKLMVQTDGLSEDNSLILINIYYLWIE